MKRILWKRQVIATTVSVSIKRNRNRGFEIHEQSDTYKEVLKIISVKCKQIMRGFQDRSEDFYHRKEAMIFLIFIYCLIIWFPMGILLL